LAPGLALADELRRHDPEAEILFLLSGRSVERRLLGAGRFPARAIPSAPWRGWRGAAEFVFHTVRAWHRAAHVVRAFEPDVFVGLGGYGSFASGIAAVLKRLPALLLEQNVIPGKATRALSRVADVVCCQWPESSSYFSGRVATVVTGNPIRREMDPRYASKEHPELYSASDSGQAPTVLIMGGSQGARALNERGVQLVARLAPRVPRLRVIHLTGPYDREKVESAYHELSVEARVWEFLQDMSAAYAVSDVAVGRAGGSSIAELFAWGIPMVLVPYPFAGGHQEANARAVEARGAGYWLPQDDASPELLAEMTADVLLDEDRRQAMRRSAQQAAAPEAASAIRSELLRLTQAKRKGQKTTSAASAA